MVHIVEDKEVYQKSINIIESIIKSNNLPNYIFSHKPVRCFFYDVDHIMYNQNFIDRVIDMAKDTSDGELFWHCLMPDSDKYYFKNFNKYGLVVMGHHDRPSELFSVLNEEPEMGPDSLINHSSIFVIVPRTGRWIIYGNRIYGIGIAALFESSIESIFVNSIGQDSIHELDKLIDIIRINTDPKVYNEILDNFIKNYGLMY